MLFWLLIVKYWFLVIKYIDIGYYNIAKLDISLSLMIEISNNILDLKIFYSYRLITMSHTFPQFEYLYYLYILRYDWFEKLTLSHFSFISSWNSSTSILSEFPTSSYILANSTLSSF